MADEEAVLPEPPDEEPIEEELAEEELALLQLRVNEVFRRKVDMGTSYIGTLKHPGFMAKDTSLRLNFMSATEGRWRSLYDAGDERHFTVTQQGDRIKFADAETELDGTVDEHG